ncbi:MAG: alpha-L-fucosidase [Paludibacteraceae bacterium]
MKLRILILLLFAVQLLPAQEKPAQKWLDQKFSMFIHFGLYSLYGGVYDGKPVTKGYSEQIQSFAGIFSDWYAEKAQEFNPLKWNPYEIVALAKAAGMRSIVFTSKHHDGFCMYHSNYTDFNIVDATPYKKDLMKELSEACKQGGIDFAVYFSLIDWHFPQAYPISSHNADPLTPEHFQYNLNQVEEIMTNYGPISEIWFDMGSLTTEQSKGLYDLVNRLQPKCMISGRLGNNYVDFSVMADNEYPDYKISIPWQTAASMFDETWGYRSWQKRGDIQKKVNEKIASLIKVISRGGNYLLNIGPKGDGLVVDFEKEVLERIGKWVKTNSEAIYATKANPFPRSFPWGDVTTKNNKLYLFVKKGNSTIDLQRFTGKIAGISIISTGEKCMFSQNIKTNSVHINVPANSDSIPVSVLKVDFREKFNILPTKVIKSNLLTTRDAVPEFGYSSLDYYCGYKSLTSYTWNFQKSGRTTTSEIFFTENESGRKIKVQIDGNEKEVTLSPTAVSKMVKIPVGVKFGNLYTKKGSGIFGYVAEENHENADISDWEKITNFNYVVKQEKELSPREGVLFLQEIESTENRPAAVKIGSGNAAYILLNGKFITAHLLPTKEEYQKEIVVLPLKKGKNQLIIKYFNRHINKLNYSIELLTGWRYYKMKLPEYNLSNLPVHQLTIRAANPDSKVSPLRMNNIEILRH